MNLAAIDLNLLKVFEAVMAERHVTKAAARLGLAQPSMSNALSRLRHLFGDALFVRTPTGMQPTPRALALAVPIAGALTQVRTALSEEAPFQPASAERTVRIVQTDYMELMVLPLLVGQLETEAPGLRIRSRTLDRLHALDRLDRGDVDICLGVFDELPSRFRVERLFEERFVCIARRDHPAFCEPITPERFADLPHVLASTRGDDQGVVDRVMRPLGLKRRVVASVSSFAAVPFIVGGTDYVATLPSRVAQRLAGIADVKIHAPPIPMPTFAVSLVWTAATDLDTGFIWLRDRIRQLLAG